MYIDTYTADSIFLWADNSRVVRRLTCSKRRSSPLIATDQPSLEYEISSRFKQINDVAVGSNRVLYLELCI